MFSTIVYSVLLAFALSDIGGSGLAVAVQERAYEDPCPNLINECAQKVGESGGTTSMQACSNAKARADCFQNLKDTNVGKDKDCTLDVVEKHLNNDEDIFKVPTAACACCGTDVYTAVKKHGKTLADDHGSCSPPTGDTCMLCQVDNNTLSDCFKGKKDCQGLLDGIACATKQIHGPCSDSDLTNHINAQQFVITDAAECHSTPCTSLIDALDGNYTAKLKVKNGSTEATECLPVGAAFRLGSAIAPLLGALGIVLITFKIL